MSNTLNALKDVVVTPDQDVFKIGPEQIEELVGRIIVMMGASGKDIDNIQVGQSKKHLRICAMVSKKSDIFSTDCDDNEQEEGESIFTMFRAQTSSDEVTLSRRAKDVIEELGFTYRDEDDRQVCMVDITEYKKGVELQFNADVLMAILTDTDYTDPHFVVDASEEAIQKKKHNSHKFKGKKKMIVFAIVRRTHKVEGAEGFHPIQVQDWKSNADDEDCE